MKVVGITKTTVTVTWAWQNKSGPVQVNRYRVMLRKDSERQSRFSKEFFFSEMFNSQNNTIASR